MKLNRLLLIGAIISAVLVVGCIGGPQGKYLRLGDPDQYLELDGDGTFYAQQKSEFSERTSGFSGNWKQKDNEIILSTSLGSARVKMEGDTLIDPDGIVWIKEGQYEKLKEKYEKETEKLIVGKYVGVGYYSAYKGNSLDISEDHRYLVRYPPSLGGENKEWGTWKINGNEITISPSGQTSSYPSASERAYKIKKEGTLTLNEPGLTGNDIITWEKQGQSAESANSDTHAQSNTKKAKLAFSGYGFIVSDSQLTTTQFKAKMGVQDSATVYDFNVTINSVLSDCSAGDKLSSIEGIVWLPNAEMNVVCAAPSGLTAGSSYNTKVDIRFKDSAGYLHTASSVYRPEAE